MGSGGGETFATGKEIIVLSTFPGEDLRLFLTVKASGLASVNPLLLDGLAGSWGMSESSCVTTLTTA
jgi:hypothetical protein